MPDSKDEEKDGYNTYGTKEQTEHKRSSDRTGDYGGIPSAAGDDGIFLFMEYRHYMPYHGCSQFQLGFLYLRS